MDSSVFYFVCGTEVKAANRTEAKRKAKEHNLAILDMIQRDETLDGMKVKVVSLDTFKKNPDSLKVTMVRSEKRKEVSREEREKEEVELKKLRMEVAELGRNKTSLPTPAYIRHREVLQNPEPILKANTEALENITRKHLKKASEPSESVEEEEEEAEVVSLDFALKMDKAIHPLKDLPDQPKHKERKAKVVATKAGAEADREEEKKPRKKRAKNRASIDIREEKKEAALRRREKLEARMKKAADALKKREEREAAREEVKKRATLRLDGLPRKDQREFKVICPYCSGKVSNKSMIRHERSKICQIRRNLSGLQLGNLPGSDL